MAETTAHSRPGLLGPRLLAIHLLALALVIGMVAMGWWQSDRYDSQRASASAQAAAAAARADAVALDSVLPPDGAFPGDKIGVKVAATGSYAPARQQFFVRGKQQDGHAGYWVLAPLLTGRSAVLVVRGWVRHPSDPAASSVPTGPVRVIGWLQPPEPASTPYGPASDSRVVTAVSTASLVAQVPYDLYSGYLVVAEQRPPERQLDLVERPVAPGSGTAGWRNLAYAGQWWLFAAFVAFMWWRIVRDARVA